MAEINNFVINIGTVNGSGSQSANNILVKSLFRCGLPVCGKNLFPSNIAGLPTWFTIRVAKDGHLSRSPQSDILVAMNADSLKQDVESLPENGFVIFNSDLKVKDFDISGRTNTFALPCRKLVGEVTDSIKLKKLLTNMLYVGALTRLLGVDKDTLFGVVKDTFANKENVVELNFKAIEAGYNYTKENFKGEFLYKVEPIENGNSGKILLDGNTAGALGLLFGGCSFLSWYPITPSSSLAENFSEYCKIYRKDEAGKINGAIVQAEDELSAISMVIGAGWAGARAATATSGPGLSLMAEAAGYAYFAEIPAVIWDVQRAGPSTGLPTRTMQGDLNSAYKLSHGDTQHVVLLPANPEECFEFGQLCFDLAEELQTLVIVLSDLDLGMNFSIAKDFEYPVANFNRGRIYKKEDIEKLKDNFGRYMDVEGDGICPRTLPGTHHTGAAYFTRGTGHDEMARYSENNENYARLLDRLKKKSKTARSKVPQPHVEMANEGEVGVIAFGSSDPAIREARSNVTDKGLNFSYLRLRALPLTNSVHDFIRQCRKVYVVEQNRDGQLRGLLCEQFPESAHKLHSILQYDGLPLAANFVSDSLLKSEKMI